MGLISGRNEEYIRYAIRHTTDVAILALILKLFPGFTRRYCITGGIDNRLISQLIPMAGTSRKVIHKYIAPIVEERYKAMTSDEHYQKPVRALAFTH